jgi:tetratricopeptide (TPR) repeat protein
VGSTAATGLIVAKAVRGIQAARRATVQVWDESKEDGHRGQGLLLNVEGEGAVVLTCHHVIAPVERENLRVRIPQEDGSLGDPLPVRYAEERSHPMMDAVVLSINEVLSDERPLLHRISLEQYNGQLSATVLIRLEPYSFDATVRVSESLTLTADGGSNWPDSPERYEVRAFRLARAGITKPGVSGGVAVCEEGVLGLVHFSRPETPDQEREGYLVPLTVWAEGWPGLDDLIEPLIDQNLRNAAKVHPVRELDIGTDVVVANYRSDLYIEREVDQGARDALELYGGVLIVGKPKSGKTRLAWQMLRDRPKALVVIPDRRNPRLPATFERSGLVGSDAVLFFDDLHDGAEIADPLKWWRQLEDATGRRCLLICTSRDGNDWNLLSNRQGQLLRELGTNAIVFVSESGEPGRERGENLSLEQGRRLANALAMTTEKFRSSFDGTPGSLLLDTDDMGRRYLVLRTEEHDGVSLSRLLDSAKLLYEAGQPYLRAEILRTVAEEIRGNRRISSETWDALLRRTQEEGFGRLDEFSNLQTYRPYLEECVSYTPREEEINELIPVLTGARDVIGLLSLGTSYYKRSKFRKALYAVDQAICLDSNFAVAWGTRTIILTPLGRAEEALEASDRALSLDPDFAFAWAGRSIALYSLGHSQEALEASDRALSLNPNLAHAWGSRAIALSNAGRYQEALEASDRAVSLDPDFASGWASKAAALIGLGHSEGALEANARALSLNPDSLGMWINLVGILTSLGRYEEALKASDRALSLDTDSFAGWLSRAVVLSNAGRYQEALEASDRALSLNPNFVLAWDTRVDVLTGLGRYEEVLEAIERAMSLGVFDNLKAWLMRGTMLDILERYEEALEAYDKASHLAPGNPEISYSKGGALLSLGRYEEALEAYNKTLNLQPDYADAWHDKGISLIELGRTQEALEAYDEALRFEPDWSLAWYNKALALADVDRVDEAVKLLCQVWYAREQDPDLARGAVEILEEWGHDPEECEP